MVKDITYLEDYKLVDEYINGNKDSEKYCMLEFMKNYQDMYIITQQKVFSQKKIKMK